MGMLQPRRCAPNSCVNTASRYGFHVPGRAIVIDAISLLARGRVTRMPTRRACPCHRVRAALAPHAMRRAFFDGGWLDAPFFARESLRPGDVIDGPAVICERHNTIVVERGWRAALTAADNLVLEKSAPARRETASTRADPVLLEIFNNLFMAIAEQMGVTLANTASSVNIKERLDFSCALFDAQGQLIANAPHMPVHLGSMGESVQEILRRRAGSMQPGDAFVLNAPYAGGTHLPDVTVVMPVFLAQARSPSSTWRRAAIMPTSAGSRRAPCRPDSKNIDEEGVLLDNVQLVERGVFLEDAMRTLLSGGAWPARNVTQNLADLRAQVAACQKGIAELEAMTAHYGLEVVRAYMQHVQDNAEAAVRQVIDVLTDGDLSSTRWTAAPACSVAIRIDRERREATIDFTGTSAQQPDNFNAPLPVTRAAVLYVFRTLVDDEIPMNAGCLKPLKIIVPEGSMLNPRYPAAVVAGNVETSQVVTDCLYGALGVLAAIQGTMNNFTFGDEQYQYYETIAGGSGAGPGFRWHGCRPDPHDQLAAHRSRSARVALSRAAGIVSHPARLRRQAGAIAAVMAWSVASASSSPMTAVMLANRRRVAPFGRRAASPHRWPKLD